MYIKSGDLNGGTLKSHLQEKKDHQDTKYTYTEWKLSEEATHILLLYIIPGKQNHSPTVNARLFYISFELYPPASSYIVTINCVNC